MDLGCLLGTILTADVKESLTKLLIPRHHLEIKDKIGEGKVWLETSADSSLPSLYLSQHSSITILLYLLSMKSNFIWPQDQLRIAQEQRKSYCFKGFYGPKSLHAPFLRHATPRMQGTNTAMFCLLVEECQGIGGEMTNLSMVPWQDGSWTKGFQGLRTLL